MTISELVKKLEELKKEHGDVTVVVHSLSHAWAPEPEARPFNGKANYILLNP